MRLAVAAFPMEGLGIDFPIAEVKLFFVVIEKNPVSGERKDDQIIRGWIAELLPIPYKQRPGSFECDCWPPGKNNLCFRQRLFFH